MISTVTDQLSEQERLQLEEDYARAFVAEETSDGSRIIFGIEGYVRPEYQGQKSFGFEWTLKDKDGTSISVDLFKDENGRLLELELIRWGNGSLIEPDWSSLASIF
ncbi:MAG: hypothetical protein WC757_00170 [Candidatus Paceibacterota bacterium]